MLTAFLTHAYFQWWLANAQDPGRINPYHNHWLVSKSAAQAFSDGAVKLERLQPSMVEVLKSPNRHLAAHLTG